MCTSAINRHALQAHQSVKLETVLEQILMLSMRLGETCIVTNADELWVTESSRRFTPKALSLLSRIKVVSARRKYQQAYPSDMFAWKRETFREVLGESRMASGSVLNLIVLGDSPAEMQAAQTSTMGTQRPAIVKTVKFKEEPTCDELIEQLRLVAQDLPAIVGEDRSSHRSLASRLSSHSWTFPSPSSGWSLSSLALSAFSPSAAVMTTPATPGAPGKGAAFGSPVVYVAGR